MSRNEGRSRLRNRRGYSLVGLLIAVAYFAASLGAIPTPRVLGSLGILAKSSASERFPCEGCVCGCATADACWSGCCCHSLAERWAWAKANGVTPPPAFLAEVERAGLNATNGQASCELCHKEAPARMLPTLSPLACKGLSAWIALAAPIGLLGERAILPPAPEMPADQRERGLRPLVTPLEAPTPPPRA